MSALRGGGMGMRGSPGRLLLQALLALALAAASPVQSAGHTPKEGKSPLTKDEGGHRVIVRFADPRGERSDVDLLRERVQELSAKPGVAGARALERVGMAIAECDSLATEERLVRELEDDPEVELATPDTWVRFDGDEKVQPDRIWPFQDSRKCSAQTGCAALGLVGLCCPATNGLMLACCDGSGTANRVAFRTFHSRYWVAEGNGDMNANRASVDDWETFQIFNNEDGTVTLLSHLGKYVAADEQGHMKARSQFIGDAEKFDFIQNKDGSVSFKSHFGKFVVAQLDGRLLADRETAGDWEKFYMKALGSPNQRLPNDANFSALWGLNEPLRDNDIDAPEAWKTFTGEFSKGIIVGVIDTGIDYTHEDLRDNMWVNPNEIPGNGIDDDGNGIIDDVHGADFANDDGDPMDDQRHGTHCAGTIAGIGNNGVGVAGVSWHGVKLMALKFLKQSGGGKTSDAVRAIDYAIAHGARILSNSWGGGGSSAALRMAIEKAAGSGILFTAAAGNSHSNNDEDPHYPSNYASENIVAVASTDSKGLLSGFSCYGATTVDLAAPGSRIFSTIPKNGYKFLSGTSMATPHVTGLAALIWMYRPALSMMQVKEILMGSVERSDQLEGKCVTGGTINAKNALEVASGTEPPYPPVHAPKSVQFEDTDPKVGLIGGTVTIYAAADESDIDYYKVYFVSRAGYQLDALGAVNVTGERVLEMPVSSPRAMPKYAAGLVAVSGNATGEMPAQIGGRAPNVSVTDYVVPEGGPQAVKWNGDVDLREGMVAGKLLVTRAADEASITHYNIYWSNASGTRGKRLGTLAATGFMLPKCTGPSCSLINVSVTETGRMFNRDPYGNHEHVVIKSSGPATIKVTRFSTESYYDTLKIDSRELSGSPILPMKLELDEGPFDITWTSDESITMEGWTFELIQTGATAEFRVESVAPLGRGLEVVPAYGENELLEGGVFADVVDYTRQMPPSPGFAPKALYFTDLDNGTGVIAGVAEVMPHPGASNASIAYYQLDLADSEGIPVGATSLGPRANANGNKSVFISVAPIAVPPGATKLIARAGNSYGLSTGSASTEIVDLLVTTPSTTPSVPSTTDSDVNPGSGTLNPGAGSMDPGSGTQLGRGHAQHGSKDVELARPASEEPAEPWLPRPDAAEERRVVWTAAPGALASAHSAASGYVMSSVTFASLDSSAVLGPAFRKALEQTVQSQLPFVGAEGVTVTRILERSSGSAPPTGRSATDTIVEFHVRPKGGAPANAVDRMESRLIILSMGGDGAERFGRELSRRLAAAGAALPAGTRSQVGAPQEVVPARRAGRLLSEAASAEAVADSPSAPLAASQRGWEGLRIAAAVAGLAAAAGLALTVVLVRRRRGHLLARRSGLVTAALDGVHVQPGAE